jgi:hypothetical protein
MAVSGKTAAPYEIPYFLETDKPPDMGAVTQAQAERVHALFAEFKPTHGIVPMTEAKGLSKSIGEWIDLPAKLELTPEVASVLRVTLVAQSSESGEGSGVGVAEVSLSVDGGAELSPPAIIRLNSSEERLRDSGSMVYEISLTAGKTHTVQMRGRNNGGLWKPVLSTGTRFAYELVAS